ncbi:MAG: helix-turn-helix domain-containing protein [bacterium]|nr:helix-turn-helix domain-containing protein [bacterium]
MGYRTGRKEVASAQTRAKAVSIKKTNPGLTNVDIANRLGVTPRQVQYWLSKAKEKGEI